MEYRLWNGENPMWKKEAADLLREAFPDSYQTRASREVENICADERVCLIALAGETLAGLIGAIPQYGITGWELHPLAVRREFQGQGVGSRLLRLLEREVAGRGGITLYLGSDDEDGKTSLSGVDLYPDLFRQIETIRNWKRHPYSFYEKNGYRIVGVFPDVNGFGKPDIWMAKRIAAGGGETNAPPRE